MVLKQLSLKRIFHVIYACMYGTNHPQLKQSTCDKWVQMQKTLMYMRVKFTHACKIKCYTYTRIVAICGETILLTTSGA